MGISGDTTQFSFEHAATLGMAFIVILVSVDLGINSLLLYQKGGKR